MLVLTAARFVIQLYQIWCYGDTLLPPASARTSWTLDSVSRVSL